MFHTTSKALPIKRLTTLSIVAAAAALTLSAPATAAKLQPGEPAPVFSAVDTNGKELKLSSFKGKTVVLEWTNHACPYTVKHYKSGNMQKLQKTAAKDGVVWLSIVSSGKGRQGYVEPAKANGLTKSRDAAPTAVILDPTGKIGRLYKARTTPHMFVIDKAGKFAYMGAIDDRPSADPADVVGAKNYISESLAAIKAGKPVKTAATRPYGCSVKYSSRSSS